MANFLDENILELEMNEYWDKRANSYSQQNIEEFKNTKRYEWEKYLFENIDETKPLKILDIGTGPGFFAILAALRGHNVTGVDMNQAMLNEAKKNALKLGVNINFLEVGHKLEFPNETFDLIISRNVTWTLTDPENQLLNWVSKLKKGGTLKYFDAEWYFYLINENDKFKWENYKKKYIKDYDSMYKEAYKLEEVAIDLPMTYKKRPEWDRQFWGEQKNYAFYIEDDIDKDVYTEQEKIDYKLFPGFLITVKKH